MRSLISIFAVVIISSVAFAEDSEAKADEKAKAEKLAARRLEFMKTSVKDYEFVIGPDFKQGLTLNPDPLLRFTNPVSGLQDGCFVVWSSEAGRPMVGAQIFLTSEDLWIHEFQSLATVPFRVTRAGKSIWEPKSAGVERKLVPGAPQPAASAALRLTQMRDIAKRFTTSDEFEGRPKSDALRLLTKPLLRFGEDSKDTLDGALFTHAHGTDPELMILIECLKIDNEYRWYYSLAPMTGYALKVTLDDKPNWEVSWRKPPYDPKEPFFLLVHSKEISLKNILSFPK